MCGNMSQIINRYEVSYCYYYNNNKLNTWSMKSMEIMYEYVLYNISGGVMFRVK